MVLSKFLFIYFFFFRRHDNGPLHNFNRSHVMVIARSVSFSDPARPPGGGVGRPKHPKIPPPSEKMHAFQNPRNIFEKINLIGKTKIRLLFFLVLRPQEHFLAEKLFQLKIPPPLTHSCVGMPQGLQALSTHLTGQHLVGASSFLHSHKT